MPERWQWKKKETKFFHDGDTPNDHLNAWCIGSIDWSCNIRLFLENLGQGSFSTCVYLLLLGCFQTQHIYNACESTGLFVSLWTQWELVRVWTSLPWYLWSSACAHVYFFVLLHRWMQGGVFCCWLHWLVPYRLKLDLHSRCLSGGQRHARTHRHKTEHSVFQSKCLTPN